MAGQSDRAAGLPPGSAFAALHDASVEVGKLWYEDPNKTLRGMIRFLIIFTVVAGLIGAGVALFVGPKWLPAGPAWGLGVAGVAFWLDGLIIWSQLLGSMAGGKPTGRGCLVWLVLTVVLGVMLWVFVLYSFFLSLTG